jgi:hypothetical protein
MDTREKLIELIRKGRYQAENICNENMDCQSCIISDPNGNCKYGCIADHLIANGVTVQKWIPVTERLPEDSVAVNIHTSSGVVGTGFYDKQTKSWVQWYSGGSLFADVTHWMPLPSTEGLE